MPIQAKLRENEEVKFGRTPAADVVGLDNDDTISSVHFKLVYMNGFIYKRCRGHSIGTLRQGDILSPCWFIKLKKLIVYFADYDFII